jgi:hypothetical protein
MKAGPANTKPPPMFLHEVGGGTISRQLFQHDNPLESQMADEGEVKALCRMLVMKSTRAKVNEFLQSNFGVDSILDLKESQFDSFATAAEKLFPGIRQELADRLAQANDDGAGWSATATAPRAAAPKALSDIQDAAYRKWNSAGVRK